MLGKVQMHCLLEVFVGGLSEADDGLHDHAKSASDAAGYGIYLLNLYAMWTMLEPRRQELLTVRESLTVHRGMNGLSTPSYNMKWNSL